MTTPSPDHTGHPPILGSSEPPTTEAGVTGALSAIEAQINALKQAQAAQDTELSTARQALDRERVELESKAAAVEARQTELREQQERLAAAQRNLEAEHEALERQLEQAAEQEREAADRAAALTAESESLAGREAALAEREKAIEAAAPLQAERDEAVARMDALKADLEARERDVETLRSELERVRSSALTPDRVESLVEERVEAAQREWSAKATPAPTPAGGPSEAEFEAAKRDAADARKEVGDLRARLAKLQSAAEGSGAGQAPPDAEHQLLKRDVAIKALREKLTGATEQNAALVERLAQADAELASLREAAETGPMAGGRSGGHTTDSAAERTKIVEEREALAEQAEALASREQRVASRASWAKASFTTVVIVIIVGLCGAGSWVGAGRFAPATYVAHAEIEADERERRLTPAERSAWTSFHEDLVLDPQLLDRVSARMRTRGDEALGNPSDLHDALETRMDVATPEPGVLTFALRGEGAVRTQRRLETFLTSYLGYSNSTRDVRLDRSGVVVVRPASVDGAPVHDPRLQTFWIAFGGSSLAAMLLVLVLSRGASRDPFERDAPVDDDRVRI